jgi:hypothetical protein
MSRARTRPPNTPGTRMMRDAIAAVRHVFLEADRDRDADRARVRAPSDLRLRAKSGTGRQVACICSGASPASTAFMPSICRRSWRTSSRPIPRCNANHAEHPAAWLLLFETTSTSNRGSPSFAGVHRIRANSATAVGHKFTARSEVLPGVRDRIVHRLFTAIMRFGGTAVVDRVRE